MYDITMGSINVFKAVIFHTCVVLFFGENVCKGEECNNDLNDKSAAVRLSNNLFCGYNTNVRPLKNQNTQMNINITFYLSNIHMNEDWNVLQMSIQLYMTWVDEFLKWEPSSYDNISRIHENSNQIWMPDVMSLDEGFIADQPYSISSGLPSSMVWIKNTGIVKYFRRITLNSQCQANIKSWPFDSHKCTFYIGSMIYRNDAVNFTFDPSDRGGFEIFNLEPNKEWELKSITHDNLLIVIGNKIDSSDSGKLIHRIPRYFMTLQRFSSMYYSSVIIPIVVISLMRTFTFLINLEYLIRIILLSLFFISELLYIQFLDTKLPNNGKNPVDIVLLSRNSLILTAAAIALNIVSNELYKRGAKDIPRNRPEWIKSVSALLLNNRFFVELTKFNTQDSELLVESDLESANSERNENALFWKRTSILLDRLSLVIILIMSILNFLVYFLSFMNLF